MADYICCTIVTTSHLRYALALTHSLRQFDLAAPMAILISDHDGGALPEGLPAMAGNTRFYSPADFAGEPRADQLYKLYADKDKDAYRWSMKSVLIRRLLAKEGFDKVIYLDCDIYCHGDYRFILAELDRYSIVLTPHWRVIDPRQDEGEFRLLHYHGIYNGGVVAANRSAVDAMRWWADACAFRCEKNALRGAYVDQKYLEHFPILFDNVRILPHRGCNLGCWNIATCPRSNDPGGKVVICGKWPVIFIHFNYATVQAILAGRDPLLAPYLRERDKMLERSDLWTNAPLQSEQIDSDIGREVEQEIFNAVLSDCRQKGYMRIGIYGAGAHTGRLLQSELWQSFDQVIVIDDDRSKKGRVLGGFLILPPEQAAGYDAILISSDTCEEQLYYKAINWVPRGTPVIKIYDSQQR